MTFKRLINVSTDTYVYAAIILVIWVKARSLPFAVDRLRIKLFHQIFIELKC